ncbi:DUF397 domain-containing protein [Streptomyces sp. RFCAC02]|uniref:DUF397 domain-containing protein n=1 Tax=Streptomyces sp. RFCAC02 TaxID=2499143 RepID=UPI00101EC0BD|nr:DUF397 domain-containing protein [Streptomyces sp. RFCAC02]
MNDMVEWRKSTYSNGSSACVEVARLAGGAVAMRDSKQRDGAVLRVPGGGWAAFVTGVARRSLGA